MLSFLVAMALGASVLRPHQNVLDTFGGPPFSVAFTGIKDRDSIFGYPNAGPGVIKCAPIINNYVNDNFGSLRPKEGRGCIVQKYTVSHNAGAGAAYPYNVSALVTYSRKINVRIMLKRHYDILSVYLPNNCWGQARVFENNSNDASVANLLTFGRNTIKTSVFNSRDNHPRPLCLFRYGIRLNHSIGCVAGVLYRLTGQTHLLPNQDGSYQRYKRTHARKQGHIERPSGHALLGREVALFMIFAAVGGWVCYRSFHWFGNERNIGKALSYALIGFAGGLACIYSLILLVGGAV